MMDMIKELDNALSASRLAYAAELTKSLLADDMQRICLKCAHMQRLEKAESELADARELIASQAETIEALENKITALEAIISSDTPASVADEWGLES